MRNNIRMKTKAVQPKPITGKYGGVLGRIEDRIRQLPHKAVLSDIKQYSKQIAAGNYKVVFLILERVVSRDFHPEIIEAGKAALAPIKEVESKKTGWWQKTRPYAIFGFDLSGYMTKAPAYFLGALYEMLPREFAIEYFAFYHLPYRCYVPQNVIKGLQILLRFSSLEAAADFLIDLSKSEPDKTKRLLGYNNCQARYYPYQRYSIDELKEAFQQRF